MTSEEIICKCSLDISTVLYMLSAFDT